MKKYIHNQEVLFYKTNQNGIAFTWISRDLDGRYITCALTKIGLIIATRNVLRSRDEILVEKRNIRY